MKPTEVKVGGFFVNEELGSIREIVLEESDDVYWRSYDLSTGEPRWGMYFHSKQQIIEWADREATLEEVSRLQRKRGQQDIETEPWFVSRVLTSVPDEVLLTEVRRRGLRW